MAEYLNKSGVQYLWNKIKEAFGTHTVHVEVSEDGGVQADKTYSAVLDLIQSEKRVVVELSYEYSNDKINLTDIMLYDDPDGIEDALVFSGYINGNTRGNITFASEGVFYEQTIMLTDTDIPDIPDTSDFETISNKVTSISSSNSDDAYPTANAVKTFVEEKGYIGSDDISGKENISNKFNSDLDTATSSTTQYPTVNAVTSFVENHGYLTSQDVAQKEDKSNKIYTIPAPGTAFFSEDAYPTALAVRSYIQSNCVTQQSISGKEDKSNKVSTISDMGEAATEGSYPYPTTGAVRNYVTDKISTKEDTDNKVLSTTGLSNSSTDTQYPSAKTVYNECQAIREVAEGKCASYVYNTVAELDVALTNTTFTSTLNVGDVFLIKAVDVPDYWWTGTGKSVLETTKVDLTNYSVVGHTHTASQITGLPTSLPANGGNADTIDGWHIRTASTGDTGLAGYITFIV